MVRTAWDCCVDSELNVRCNEIRLNKNRKVVNDRWHGLFGGLGGDPRSQRRSWGALGGSTDVHGSCQGSHRIAPKGALRPQHARFPNAHPNGHPGCTLVLPLSGPYAAPLTPSPSAPTVFPHRPPRRTLCPGPSAPTVSPCRHARRTDLTQPIFQPFTNHWPIRRLFCWSPSRPRPSYYSSPVTASSNLVTSPRHRLSHHLGHN